MKILDCIIVKFVFRLVNYFYNYFFYRFLSNIFFYLVNDCIVALCLISFAATERTPCPAPVRPDSAALYD